MNVETLADARAEAVWELLARQAEPGRRRSVTLDQALGAVLAEPALAQFDYPPFDRAVMDGFALRASDAAPGPARLALAGSVSAGVDAPADVPAGACVRINTGAPLPPGTDAVVMVERTRPRDDGLIDVDDHPVAGQNIERRGALRRRGDVLVDAPTRIRAGTIAALAAGGCSEVVVYVRPQVALLTTGDELIDCGERLRPGQIHDSNGVGIEELIRRAGADVASRGRCADEPGALRAALELGLAHDLLCVTGGMSKGTHDLVPRLLEELGVRWLVCGLDLKPGKPTRIGRHPRGAWVVGLPGNPVSAAICFLLFAAPLLDALAGLPLRPPPMLAGALDAPLLANGARPMFHPAVWRAADGGARLTPLEWRGSGDPFALATANALIYRPDRADAAGAGERVSFILLDAAR